MQLPFKEPLCQRSCQGREIMRYLLKCHIPLAACNERNPSYRPSSSAPNDPVPCSVSSVTRVQTWSSSQHTQAPLSYVIAYAVAGVQKKSSGLAFIHSTCPKTKRVFHLRGSAFALLPRNFYSRHIPNFATSRLHAQSQSKRIAEPPVFPHVASPKGANPP